MSKQIGDKLKNQVIAQVDEVINRRNRLRAEPRPNATKDNDLYVIEQILATARLAIECVCPPNSPLRKQMETTLAGSGNEYVKMDGITAIAATLKQALQNDWLDEFQDLIHGELFSDFLEMAEHLLEEGYKDGAAVIAGGTLESNLRQLCLKYGIPVTVQKRGKQVPKTASAMNDDLRRTNVYPASQQKLLSGFIDLRNDAAHGHYNKYEAPAVRTMIMGIRSFQQSHPA